MKLRDKFISLFVIIGVIPMIAVATFSYNNLTETIDEIVVEGSRSLLFDIGQKIDPIYAIRKSDVRLLARNRPIRDWLPNTNDHSETLNYSLLTEVEEFLDQFVARDSELYKDISYYDENGRHLLSFKKTVQSQISTEAFELTQNEISLTDTEIGYLAKHAGLQLQTTTATGKPELVLSHPVTAIRTGKLLGYVILTVDISVMIREFFAGNYPNTSRLSSSKIENTHTPILIRTSTAELLWGSASTIDQSENGELLRKVISSAKETTNATIEEKTYYTQYKEFPDLDWTLFIISVPTGLTESTERAIDVNLGITGMTALLTIFLIPLVASRITASIRSVTAGAEKIAHGDIDYEIEVSTKDETKLLANAVNQMARKLSSNINELTLLTENLDAKVKERTHQLETAHEQLLETQQQVIDEMDRELQTARALQMDLMPTESPKLEGIEIVGDCRSATHVGGDLYKFYQQNGTVSVLAADVTGHAMEAAIPVVMFDGILDSQIEIADGLTDLFDRLNHRLCKKLGRRTFICCTFLQMDLATNQIQLTNAGCPYPYFFRAEDNAVAEIESDAFPLGLRANSQYSVVKLGMSAGDRIVLCSDGIIEAMNSAGDIFGYDQTKDLILNSCMRGASAADIMNDVFSAVGSFSGDCDQNDDQTVVVISS